MNPLNCISCYISNVFIFGLIYSLIIGAIVKNEKPQSSKLMNLSILIPLLNEEESLKNL